MTALGINRSLIIGAIGEGGGRRSPKCRQSKGGTCSVILVPWIRPECKHGGGGQKFWKLCRRHLSMAPYLIGVITSYQYDNIITIKRMSLMRPNFSWLSMLERRLRWWDSAEVHCVDGFAQGLQERKNNISVSPLLLSKAFSTCLSQFCEPTAHIINPGATKNLWVYHGQIFLHFSTLIEIVFPRWQFK